MIQRLVVLAVLGAGGCRPAPVLNPHKTPAPLGPVQRADAQLSEAPGGMVTSREGAKVDLATLWASQAVVVVFYKGHWCPPCQRQLGELEQRRNEFTTAGATVIGISSDAPADLAALRDKLTLSFEVYADPQLNVISQWGVEDLGKGIARPATFIIAPGGEVVFQHIGKTEADRPDVQTMLDALPRTP